MLKGQEKIDAILFEINAGKSVYFSTCTTTVKVTKRVLNRFIKGGNDLFRTNEKGDVFIASGKKWNCINLCKITCQYE